MACAIEGLGSSCVHRRTSQETGDERPIEPPPFGREPMPSVTHALNQLLQALPAAEFEALRPHLEFVELVRESVLVEAGAPLTHVYLPHSGVISLVVNLSEGQTWEWAMFGGDGVLGAVAGLG